MNLKKKLKRHFFIYILETRLGCLLAGLPGTFFKFPVSGLASSPQKAFVNCQNTSVELIQAISQFFTSRFLFLTTDERGISNVITAILL